MAREGGVTRRTRRSWGDFWGEFLLVRFHEKDPNLWPLREAKAQWVWDNLKLSPGDAVLDLGCGDGLLDICLARKGVRVTAVDRLRAVLEAARRQAGDAPVSFVVGDLRALECEDSTFHGVIAFELLGLMSREDDTALLANAFRWLRPGGALVVDSPLPPERLHGRFERDTDEGRLTIESTYDAATRLQHLVPTIESPDGSEVVLYDPYSLSREHHEGVLRSLYPRDELAEILTRLGFRVTERQHYSSPTHYLLVGEKPK